MKKPVDLDFLEFTTREIRERLCHKEVSVNPRLASDVY
jgi:aminoglycoside phosphotransferase family enzyme